MLSLNKCIFWNSYLLAVMLTLAVLMWIRYSGYNILVGQGKTNRLLAKHSTKYCLCGQNEFILQRNNISNLLNQKQQEAGQMKCEIISKDKSRHQTSEAGGWCPIATKTEAGTTVPDRKLVKTLAEFFNGKTVGSFGDGPGLYKKDILALGKVKLYDAYDGGPFCEKTSGGLVNFLDLSIPQYGLPVYDWILSLEVAEHIPKQYEAIFLSNLVRHAREGVILSWSVVGQVGYSHVNNRPVEYVIESMSMLGFRNDVNATNIVTSGTGYPYLKRNIKVYVRKVKKSYCDLMCYA